MFDFGRGSALDPAVGELLVLHAPGLIAGFILRGPLLIE